MPVTALLGNPCPALLLGPLLSTGLCSFDDEGLVEWMYHPQALETYWLVPYSQSSDSVQQDPYLPAWEWQQQESRKATAYEQ